MATSQPKKRGRKKETKTEQIEDAESEAHEENQSDAGDGNQSGRKKRVGKGKRSFFGDEDTSSVDDLSSVAKSTPKKRSRGSEVTVEIITSGTKKKPRKGEVPTVPTFALQNNEAVATDAPSPVYFDLSNPHTTNFPVPIVRLIDLWIRWLVIFVKRLDEIEMWKKHSCQVITSSYKGGNGINKTPKKAHHTRDHQGHEQISAKDWHSIILKPDDEPSVVKLLDWAKQRNLSCSTRKLIERRYQNSLDWHQKVTDIFNVKSCRVSLEDTQLILKECDDSLLFVYPDLVQSLKDHIKRAKAWLQKLEKTVDTGREGGNVGVTGSTTISTTELDKIMPETETICVDLSAQINTLLQHTKVYCFCRKGYHGMMLGCEKCDDWYHTTCLGYTKIQVCLRFSHILSSSLG